MAGSRPPRATLGLAALVAVAGAGCFETSFRDGQFACAADGSCPPGFDCVADACVREPGPGGEGDGGADRGDGAPGGDGGPGDPFAGRASGAIALYPFDEGGGTTVHDISGVVTPLDLEITVPPNVTWNRAAGTLRLDGETNIVPPPPAQATLSTKVRVLLQNSRAFTVEAWITPAQAATSGPRRIVALSLANDDGSLVVAQGGRTPLIDRASFALRLRTSNLLEPRGLPAFETPDGSAGIGLTHLVFTRAASGAVGAYVDGQPVATTVFDVADEIDVAADSRDGDFSVWPATHVFGLGNELTGGRQWLGTLHLVAVYSRALSAQEVAQNFAVGADPEVAAGP